MDDNQDFPPGSEDEFERLRKLSDAQLDANSSSELDELTEDARRSILKKIFVTANAVSQLEEVVALDRGMLSMHAVILCVAYLNGAIDGDVLTEHLCPRFDVADDDYLPADQQAERQQAVDRIKSRLDAIRSKPC